MSMSAFGVEDSRLSKADDRKADDGKRRSVGRSTTTGAMVGGAVGVVPALPALTLGGMTHRQVAQGSLKRANEMRHELRGSLAHTTAEKVAHIRRHNIRARNAKKGARVLQGAGVTMIAVPAAVGAVMSGGIRVIRNRKKASGA